MTDSRPLPPPAIVDRCARAWLTLAWEARLDYRWHTSDARAAKEPAMSLALCKTIIERAEEVAYPLDLDAVLDEWEASR